MAVGSEQLVSIVMPVWRPRQDWLSAAVDSCLAQEGCATELVVVDDGCDEPVADMLAGFGDPRLRLIRIEHAGVAAARNAGTTAARGSWLRFVDADDVCEPASTSRLLALAAGEPAVAYGATLICDEALRPRWTMTARANGDVRETCLLGGFSVRLPALLFPRAVVDQAGPWDPAFSICEDWDFILRAVEHAPVRGERTVAARYRRHSRSATADVSQAEYAVRRVVAGYFARHPEDEGGVLQRRSSATTEAILARIALTHGDPRVAAAHARRALAADPRGVFAEAGSIGNAIRGHARRVFGSSRP